MSCRSARCCRRSSGSRSGVIVGAAPVVFRPETSDGSHVGPDGTMDAFFAREPTRYGSGRRLGRAPTTQQSEFDLSWRVVQENASIILIKSLLHIPGQREQFTSSTSVNDHHLWSFAEESARSLAGEPGVLRWYGRRDDFPQGLGPWSPPPWPTYA